MTTRIDIDFLDYDHEKGITTYNDQPFSGIAFEKRKDGGLDEVMLLCGIKQGLTRVWYSSGNIQLEESYYNGGVHGISQEWYENGQLKKEIVHEFSVKVKETIWDEKGDVISMFNIVENDPHYRSLELRRKSFRTNFCPTKSNIF